MSIVDLNLQLRTPAFGSRPEVRTWRTVPVHHEGNAKAQGTDTVGHTAVQPGLRGHSIGKGWPYRVVGVGGAGEDNWQVHMNGCRQRLVGMSCQLAHDVAALLAKRHHSRLACGSN